MLSKNDFDSQVISAVEGGEFSSYWVTSILSHYVLVRILEFCAMFRLDLKSGANPKTCKYGHRVFH